MATKERQTTHRHVGAWIFMLALMWLLLAAFGLYSWKTGRNMEVLGQFGDSFGVLNGLFTALAFGFLVWNSSLQRNAIDLQQEALLIQERELRDTRRVVAIQSFESTFFRMLQMVREVQASMRAPLDAAQGDEALEVFANSCKGILLGAMKSFPDGNVEARKRIGDDYVGLVYRGNDASIGPFFRTLYHTYKLIDRQEMTIAEKREYGNMARAQLSGDALQLLAANCCTEYGEGFKDLVERYGILKHYPDRTVKKWLAVAIYKPSAFEGASRAG